jgi:hypothetical protein
MKAWEGGVEYTEWELNRHYLQARRPEHEQNVEKGMGHVGKQRGPHHH